MDLSWIPTAVSWGSWFFRQVRLNHVVWQVRNHATIGVFQPLHFNILHRMRRLAAAMEEWEGGQDRAVQLATQICTDCRVLMGNVLELPDNKLHCCIKVIAGVAEDNADIRIGTWVRSEPMDDRPVERGGANAHRVGNNSVWSALYGVSDERTNWRNFRCFSCNDLHARGDEFVCDRQNWQRYYRSAVVFPIRYPVNRDGAEGEYEMIGFIAFDSPDAGAFRGFPNIYDHLNDIATYNQKLEASAAFHVGAIFADMLGTFLMGIHRQHNMQGG